MHEIGLDADVLRDDVGEQKTVENRLPNLGREGVAKGGGFLSLQFGNDGVFLPVPLGGECCEPRDSSGVVWWIILSDTVHLIGAVKWESGRSGTNRL
jgi:hypothetical protein